MAAAARFSLCALLWFHLAAAELSAATFTVTSLTDNGTGSLRDAIQNASSGDIIRLGVSGTITLTNGELLISKDLSITAPGAKTIAVSGNNAARVFNISNATVTISGLTIRDGFVSGSPAIGAGILNRGLLVLSDCHLFANTARGAAGIDAASPPARFGKDAWGAGLFNQGTATVRHCSFELNQAIGGNGGRGGQLLGNGTAGGSGGQAAGGSIYNSNVLTVLNSTFWTNSVAGGHGGTGGDGQCVYGNIGGNGGGGGNGQGASIASAGNLTLVNCTLIGSSARGGMGGEGGLGGVACVDAVGEAGFNGGGFAAGLEVSAGSARLQNTIVALNTATDGNDDVMGIISSLSRNLIGKTNGSTGWSNNDLKGSAAQPLNPILTPPGYYGGSTPTSFLQDGSPAIDAGDNSVMGDSFGLTTDQRGRPRRQRNAVDIGAFERDPGNLHMVVNANDGLAVLGTFRQALINANGTAESDTILFNIAGAGVKTISPLSALPSITGPVIIDGFSQPGASANTAVGSNNAVVLIELNGTTADPPANGLTIQTSNCLVRGLVINRFKDHGISLAGGGHSNIIEGNFIGTDATGALDRGNGLHGIAIDTSANRVVGNVIAFNGTDGIFVSTGTENRISGNAIFSNDGLGIDLGPDGVNINDAGDTDTGANNGQNFPILTSAISGRASAIDGILDSALGATYRLEFFASDAFDPSGDGEGQTFLGAINVMVGNAPAQFHFTPAATLTAGKYVTATASDAQGNTSEFSPALQVVPPGTPVILADGQSHPSGAYTAADSVQVQIHSTFPNATILFTLNGDPPETGFFYTEPFVVDASAIVRVLAYNADFSQALEAGPLVITIQSPPVITAQPASQEALIGTDVTFLVSASGTAPLSYQWFFNGSPILNAATASLVRPNVQPADAGDYWVVVTNSFGSATSAVASLTVLFPPGLSGQPASTNVSPDQSVTFCVMAGGTPPLFYQWRKNGVNILGAIDSCYAIPNVQIPDGGIYDVIVANGAGAVTSDGARLTVNLPKRPPGNNFEDRVGISNAVGTISGTNLFANSEPGEPTHAGKPGGSSIWYKWRAPFAGVATFDTRGSSFDTLLAIYRGTGFNTFTNVASDDDGGAFGTSGLRYNTEADVEYAIAIDGFAGAQGDFVLSWKLVSEAPLPEITLQPMSQTVSAGSTVLFLATAEGDNLTYQWYFNGSEISKATNASLLVSNAQTADVGSYTMRVSNPDNQTVESQPAFLEIGPSAEAASEDKFEDLFRVKVPPAPFPGNGVALAVAAATTGSGFLPVSMGTIDSQILDNNSSSTQQGEPPPCGTIGGASKWFGLQPQADGLMQIDTIGSSFDTVLAVYTGTNNIFTLRTVACDNNGAPDHVRSLVKFPAKAGTNYAIAVDGVNGAKGTIVLNWRLGLPPTYASSTQTNYTARVGETLTLTALGTSVTADLVFQWLQNTQTVAGAISSNLVRQPVEMSHAGTYKVILRNFAGSVTGTVGTVSVAAPIELVAAMDISGGGQMLRLTGDPGRNYLIEGSINLIDWVPLFTNGPSFGPLLYLDPASLTLRQRFYRVVPQP